MVHQCGLLSGMFWRWPYLKYPKNGNNCHLIVPISARGPLIRLTCNTFKLGVITAQVQFGCCAVRYIVK